MNKLTFVCALAMTLTFGSLSANGQGHPRESSISHFPQPRDLERRDLVQREAERRDAIRREHGRHGHDRRDQIQHGYDWRNHERQEQAWREHDRRSHQWRNDWRDHDRQSHQWRDGQRAERYDYGARGPEFRRGGYIPYEYRARQYWVNDWYGHGLSAPPYGHHWVQIGPDFALIAIATGLIAYLVVNQ